MSAQERVKVKITLPDKVEAPVQKGTVAGKLTFFIGEEEIGETYLLYSADIPEARPVPTLFQRIMTLLHSGEGEGALAVLFQKEG